MGLRSSDESQPWGYQEMYDKNKRITELEAENANLHAVIDQLRAECAAREKEREKLMGAMANTVDLVKNSAHPNAIIHIIERALL